MKLQNLLLLILLPFSGIAQNTIWKANKEFHYSWDTVSNQWKMEGTRYVTYLDSTSILTEYTEGFENNNKAEYTYHDKKNAFYTVLKDEITYTWNKKKQVFIPSVSFRNCLGRMFDTCDHKVEVWDTIQNKWNIANSTRTSKINSQNGFYSGYKNENTYYLATKYFIDTKLELDLNQDGTPFAATYYNWIDSSSVWIPTRKFNNITWYDYDNRIIKDREEYEWVNSVWQFKNKTSSQKTDDFIIENGTSYYNGMFSSSYKKKMSPDFKYYETWDSTKYGEINITRTVYSKQKYSKLECTLNYGDTLYGDYYEITYEKDGYIKEAKSLSCNRHDLKTPLVWNILWDYQYTNTYNNQNQIQETIIQSYNSDIKQYYNLARIVYSDFATVNPTALETDQNNLSLKILPNPSSGIFELNSNASFIKPFVIYNAIGDKILESSANSLNSITVNLSNHPKGIYILKFQEGHNIKLLFE